MSKIEEMPDKKDAYYDLNSFTLGTKHNQIQQNFEQEKCELEQLKNKLKNLKDKFQKTNNNKSLHYILEKQIHDLIKQIQNIEDDNNVNEYNVKVMKSIYEYYDNNNNDKSEVFKEYLRILNPTSFYKQIDDQLCDQCGNDIILDNNNGLLICNHCGITEPALIEDNKQNYTDDLLQQDSTNYAYRKITHFRECLQQCQGKERTDIPNKIFSKIEEKLKEERITDYSRLEVKKIKAILQELKLNKYYEHAPYIFRKITGRQPLYISQQIENRFEKMFMDTQIAFKKCCPNERQNFPSYYYVLHKFTKKINGPNEWLEHFPLLKSPLKLQNMDKIWEDICNILKWDFHPSL